MPLDVLPGSAGLAVAADAAAGEDGGFAGVSEAELVGVLCAWDRVEAHAAARKLAVSAELARRNPAPPDAEFSADQVAYALAESRGRAGDLVDLAQTLQSRLPGIAAALDDGTITRYKAEIIARATALLEDAGARAAEGKVLDRAARLTPGGLRAAIAAAVMEVAPKKARERREAAARDARVERWAEDSGNAALMGCELPRTRSWPRTSGSPPGLRNCARPGSRAAWTSSVPGPSWTCCWARIPARAATAARTAADQGWKPRTRRHRLRGRWPVAGTYRVRRAGHPDRPAGHPGRAGRPARRDPRDRTGRPVASPGPGRRGRAQPQDHLVRDRDRPGRPRHRARLRPARRPVRPGPQHPLRDRRTDLPLQHRPQMPPKCRHDHRLKQHPGWTVDQLPDGTFRWNTPADRTYTTEPTRYPI
jgi:hypothetical protein